MDINIDCERIRVLIQFSWVVAKFWPCECWMNAMFRTVKKKTFIQSNQMESEHKYLKLFFSNFVPNNQECKNPDQTFRWLTANTWEDLPVWLQITLPKYILCALLSVPWSALICPRACMMLAMPAHTSSRWFYDSAPWPQVYITPSCAIIIWKLEKSAKLGTYSKSQYRVFLRQWY